MNFFQTHIEIFGLKVDRKIANKWSQYLSIRRSAMKFWKNIRLKFADTAFPSPGHKVIFSLTLLALRLQGTARNSIGHLLAYQHFDIQLQFLKCILNLNKVITSSVSSVGNEQAGFHWMFCNISRKWTNWREIRPIHHLPRTRILRVVKHLTRRVAVLDRGGPVQPEVVQPQWPRTLVLVQLGVLLVVVALRILVDQREEVLDHVQRVERLRKDQPENKSRFELQRKVRPLRTYSLSPMASHSLRISNSTWSLPECSRLFSSSSGHMDIHHSVGFSFFCSTSWTSSSSSSAGMNHC